MKYVLITPSRNEEKYIKLTLDSMVGQTLLPLRWVIVDDGSTDRTGEIAEDYAKRYPWIEVVHRPQRQQRDFAGKVHAFNAGLERIKSLPYEVLGNMDADISFDPDYMEYLLGKFAEFPKLGIAGTPMREEHYDALKDSFYNQNDVFGACQLFRRECYESVGGYTPIKWGGVDWVAVRSARLKGWQTRSFMDKIFFHHRPMGATESNIWRARFDYGRKDYYLGNHPLWEIFRVVFQVFKKPYGAGALVLLWGYVYSFATRMKRPVPDDLLRFHQQEQLQRLKHLFLNFLKNGRLKT